MTSTERTRLTFRPPTAPSQHAEHHEAAAAGNSRVAERAMQALREALAHENGYERILLKAAAGAGKSYALKRMVADALKQPGCTRIGVAAFANKQIIPLGAQLGGMLGRNAVCLTLAAERIEGLPSSVTDRVTVVSSYKEVPEDTRVILGTTHKLEGSAKWLRGRLGPASNGERLFDVLFIDEAWQLPHHRYAKIRHLAPLIVGVGDVGQLPPLDPGQNPWRGDPGHNPYRAWPTGLDEDETTWSMELPAVWRPTAAQLPLWRAFYGDWDSLTCVAAPGDRAVEIGGLSGTAADVWEQVGTGIPTLLEVDGLDEPEAADIDAPLLSVLEDLLESLVRAEITVRTTTYGESGSAEKVSVKPAGELKEDAVIAVLATRNAAVEDATEIVDRLNEKYDLPEGWLVASTVDSWQGQTNTITVALHPLSGASRLDEFNSAFGRLAVTCTRATHGLLLLSRAGLDDLLETASPRPGTPLGEPGTRELPRQTHHRILQTFARGMLDVKEMRA